MVGRLGDDLDPVVECHTENEFWQLWQLVVSVTPPEQVRKYRFQTGTIGTNALSRDGDDDTTGNAAGPTSNVEPPRVLNSARRETNFRFHRLIKMTIGIARNVPQK